VRYGLVSLAAEGSPQEDCDRRQPRRCESGGQDLPPPLVPPARLGSVAACSSELARRPVMVHPSVGPGARGRPRVAGGNHAPLRLLG
jgi:hypothetical protein